jgi:hypothetical protein
MEGFGEISPAEYIERMEFLYGATRRYFKLAKEIYGEKEWIPRLIEYLLLREQSGEMKTLKLGQYRYRAVFHDPDFRDAQGRLVGTGYRQFKREDRQTVIGLYFPPEHYPPVDGIYPGIFVAVNDMPISRIQLNGTREIDKPFGDIYWYPGFLMSLFSLEIRTSERPYYSLEIVDSIGIDESWKSTAFWFITPRRAVSALKHNMDSGLCQIVNDDFRRSAIAPMHKEHFLADRASRLLSPWGSTVYKDNPYSITYPYARAANVILRYLRRFIERKRQKVRDRIGFVIRALPGGADVTFPVGVQFSEPRNNS